MVESRTVDCVRDVCRMVEIMTGDCLVDLISRMLETGEFVVTQGAAVRSSSAFPPGTRVTMILYRLCVCDARRCGG